MKKKKISGLARIIYSIVGVSGVLTILWMIMNWATFMTMPLWSIILIFILLIGAINWGVVAICGNRNNDLFGLLGL